MENGLILEPKFSERNSDTDVINYILGDKYIFLVRGGSKGLYIEIKNYARDRLDEVYKGEISYKELREKMTFRDLKDEEICKKLNQIFKDENKRIPLLCTKENEELHFSSKYGEPDQIELLFVLKSEKKEDKTPDYKKLRKIETEIELLKHELEFLEREKKKISEEIEEGK